MLSFNWKIKTGDENDNYSTGILAEHHGAGLIEMHVIGSEGSSFFKLEFSATVVKKCHH